MRPHDSITAALDAGRYPFHHIPVYSNGLQLGLEEFSRCRDLFNRKINAFPANMSSIMKLQMLNVQLMQAFNDIVAIEEPIQEQLEQLAVEAIRELYDVPDELILDAKLKEMFDIDVDCSDEPEELDIDPERIPYLQEQINKRILLNGWSHGSSLKIWQSVHYLVKNKLDQNLVTFYDQYIAIVSISFWLMPLDMMDVKNSPKMVQGKCDLKFGKEIEIEAQGIIFPVLLHELNKGVIDALILHGLPSDVTEDELKYIYQEADDYDLEIYHYLLSPSVWFNLIQSLQVQTTDLPEIIQKLSQLESVELFNCLDIKGDRNFYLKKCHII